MQKVIPKIPQDQLKKYLDLSLEMSQRMGTVAVVGLSELLGINYVDLMGKCVSKTSDSNDERLQSAENAQEVMTRIVFDVLNDYEKETS